MTIIMVCIIIIIVMAIIIILVVYIMVLIKPLAIMELVKVAVKQFYFAWVSKLIIKLEVMLKVRHKDE